MFHLLTEFVFPRFFFLFLSRPLYLCFAFLFSRSAWSHTAKLSQLFTATGTECSEVDEFPADALSWCLGDVDSEISWCLKCGWNISMQQFYQIALHQHLSNIISQPVSRIECICCFAHRFVAKTLSNAFQYRLSPTPKKEIPILSEIPLHTMFVAYSLFYANCRKPLWTNIINISIYNANQITFNPNWFYHAHPPPSPSTTTHKMVYLSERKKGKCENQNDRKINAMHCTKWMHPYQTSNPIQFDINKIFIPK